MLYPIIGQLNRAAKFQRTDSPEEKLTKLEALLTRCGADPDQIALLAELLALPLDDQRRQRGLTPQKRKELTLAALWSQVQALSAERPVLATFEDVHWIDPTSLEFLALAVERMARTRRYF